MRGGIRWFRSARRFWAACPHRGARRKSCRGVVTNKEGINVDREFRAGAAKALAIAKENGVELAILQSRSPSCGVKEIYDGTFSGTKIPGQGVFAKMLMDEGIRVLDAGELPKIILKNEDGKCQSD